jgi:hypothetical protein
MLGVLFLCMGRDKGQAVLVLLYPVYLWTSVEQMLTFVIRGYLVEVGPWTIIPS